MLARLIILLNFIYPLHLGNCEFCRKTMAEIWQHAYCDKELG